MNLLKYTMVVVAFFMMEPIFGQIYIRGKVCDTANQTIQSMTIALYQTSDSSITDFTLSSRKGDFELKLLFAAKLPGFVVFSGSEYEDKIISLKEFKNYDFGKVVLTKKITTLADVTVRSIMPVRIKNDTIEFNASFFKTGHNAVVEDLLRRLPGVEVDIKGNIFLNGKRVNKLMIDGKDFFGSEPLVATRNLPAEIVDKLQIMDNKDDNPDGLASQGSVGKAINIELKKTVKGGEFGKAHLGAGSIDRFEAGVLANKFRDTTQLSLIGFANNLNKSSFTFSEIRSLAGFNRGGLSTLSNSKRGLAVNGVSFGGVANGLETTGGVGVNFNTIFRKLTMNIQLFHSANTIKGYSTTKIEQNAGDSALLSSIQSNNKTNNANSRIAITLRGKVDQQTDFYISPWIAFTKVTEFSDKRTESFYDTETLNTSILHTDSRSSATGAGNVFTITKKYKKLGKLLSVNSILSLSSGTIPRDLEFQNIFYIPDVIVDSSKGRRKYRIKSLAFHNSTNYQFPFSKKVFSILGMQASFIHNRNSIDASLWNPDQHEYTTPVDSLIGMVRQQVLSLQPSAGVKLLIPFGSITSRVGYEIQFSRIGTSASVMHERRNYIIPKLDINYQNYNLSYAGAVLQPANNDLNTVADNIDPLFVVKGNASLRPMYQHQATFSRFYQLKKRLTLDIYSNVSIIRNNIIYNRSYADNGIQTISPVNAATLANTTIGVGFTKSRKLREGTLSLKVSPEVSLVNTQISVNEILSDLRRRSLSVTVEPTLSIPDRILLTAAQRFNFIKAEYELLQFPNFSYTQSTTELNISYWLTKSFIISSDMTMYSNSNIPQGLSGQYALLNGSILWKWTRPNISAKLACYDILNRNTNLSRVLQDNFIRTTELQVLKRFFLLSVIYNFNKIRRRSQ